MRMRWGLNGISDIGGVGMIQGNSDGGNLAELMLETFGVFQSRPLTKVVLKKGRSIAAKYISTLEVMTVPQMRASLAGSDTIHFNDARRKGLRCCHDSEDRERGRGKGRTAIAASDMPSLPARNAA